MWRAPYIVVLTVLLAAVIWFASWVGLFNDEAEAAAHDPGAAASQSAQSGTKDIDRRLAEAAREGNIPSIKALLKAGANPNAVLFGDDTILSEAADYRQEAAMDVLLASGAKATCPVLYKAVANGVSERMVGKLIDEGAKLDAGETCSALRAAVENHRVGLARLLKARGGDPHARIMSAASTEPIAEARAKGDTEMVAALEEK